MRIVLFISLILFSAQFSYGLPYGQKSEIEIYKDVPSDLICKNASHCFKNDNQSVNSGLVDVMNRFSCNNHRSPKKMCECVQRVFCPSEEANQKLNEFRNDSSNPFSNVDTALSKISRNSDFTATAGLHASANGLLSSLYENSYLLDKCDSSTVVMSRFTNSKQKDPSFVEYRNMFKVARQNFSGLEDTKTSEFHKLLNEKIKNYFAGDFDRDMPEKDFFELVNSIEDSEDNPFDLKLFHDAAVENTSSISQLSLQRAKQDFLSLHKASLKKGIEPNLFNIRDEAEANSQIDEAACEFFRDSSDIFVQSVIDKKRRGKFKFLDPDNYISQGGTSNEREQRREEISTFFSNLSDLESEEFGSSYDGDILYCENYKKYQEGNSKVAAMFEKDRTLLAEFIYIRDVEFPKTNAILQDREKSAKLGMRLNAIYKKLLGSDRNYFSTEKEFNALIESFYDWGEAANIEVVSNENGGVSVRQRSYDVDSERSLDEAIIHRLNQTFKNRKGSRNNFNLSSIKKSNSVNLANSSKVVVDRIKKVERKLSKSVRSTKSKATQDSFSKKENIFNSNSNQNSNSGKVNSQMKQSQPQSQRTQNRSSYAQSSNNRRIKSDDDSTQSTSVENHFSSESDELKKLREELQGQKDEIAKLKLSNKESELKRSPAGVVQSEIGPETSLPSTSIDSITSLSNSLGESGSESYREDEVADSSVATGVSSVASGVQNVSSGQAQSESPSANNVANGASGSSSNSSGEEKKVSGISLSSLGGLSADVQVIEDSSLSGISPILIDSSFELLSEEEKKDKIEEILENTEGDEIYLEFPDGKVVKFLKKDEKKEGVAKEKKVKKTKTRLPAKQRRTFEYEDLKNIIDSNK